MMSRTTARIGVLSAVVALALFTACNGSNKVSPPPVSPDTSTPNTPITPVTVSAITVSAQPSLAKGTSAALTAKAIYTDSSVQDVTDEATWASSDAAIVAIVENRSATAYDCKAKALATGAATVSASFGGKTGTASVSVTAAVLIQNGLAITPSGEVSLHKGNTQPLVLTGIFTDDSHQNVTAEATWATGNGAVAAVAAGELRATGVGSTKITASFGGQQAEAAVTVGAPELTNIAIDQAPFQIVQDLTRNLSVTGHYGDGTTNVVTSQAVWSSDNSGVAEISTAGLLTARSAGSANITAKVGAFAKTVKVTVVARTLMAVEIEAEHGAFATLAQGLQAQLRAIAKYDSGHTADVTADAAWTSENARASVAAGLVTASKELTGAAHIDATFGGFTAFLVFEVTDAIPVSVKIAPAGFTIPAGLNKPLTAEATYSDDSHGMVTDQVTWSTADAAICTVSNAAGSHGLFKALKVGTCTLTAVIGGATGTASINVSNAALTKVTVTPLVPDPLPIGLSQQFKAEGTYSDDTTQDITTQVVWTSSNDAAASISNKLEARGLASGIGIGPAYIKAEDPETHMSNTVLLWVADAVIVKLDITCDKASLPKGLTAQCRAMGTYSLPAMPVQDVTEIVTWSSSDSEVASIRNSDPCGQVGWVKLGTAKITAKDPKTERVSNEFGITTVDAVLQNIEVLQSWVFERVLHTGMQQVPPNYPVEFKAYGYYSDEPRKAVAITDGANWTVPAGSDCAISANFARGTRPGVSCVVTASKDGIEHSATLKILDVVLNSILVEPTPSDLPNGMTRDFQAWGIYNVRDPLFSFGRILPYQFELTRLATWSTHDVEGTGIADVSNAAGSQGQVLAKNLGRATVQAIEPLSQISGQADLHVTDAILKEISVAPASAEIHLGEAQQFNVEATFTDGSKLDVTNSAVCHLDAVESFGPVGGSCRFQGNSQGEWTVTANYHGMTDTAAFKVSAAQLLEVEVQLCDRSQPEGDRFVFTNCRQTNSAQVMVGQNTVFRAFGRFTDTAALHGGFWEDITPFVAWDSSARDVAHVSNDLEDIGAATGLTVGESTITAVDPGRLIYDSLVLTVVPALP